MNNAQVAAVLAKIQLVDNRETDAAGLVLAEWVDTIGDLEFADAVEAVRMHRRNSLEYLQPNHVRERVRLIVGRRERAARVSAAPRVVDPLLVPLDRVAFDADYRAALAAARKAKEAIS